MSSEKLKGKQRLFVSEYLIDLNATQAAIRAGYSERNADKIGPGLLGNPRIKEAIQKAIQAREKRAGITQDYVLNTIQETIERCRQAEPLRDRDGNPVMVDLPDGTSAAAYVFDAKNVLKGCELLGKHLGVFDLHNTQKRQVVVIRDLSGRKRGE